MTQASSVEFELGAMVNLAELDTLFLVPCKSCGELLEEKDRFCPTCGKDQTATDDTGDDKAPVEPGRDASADDRAPALGSSSGLAVRPPQEARPSTGRPAAPPNRLAIGIGAALVALLAVALTYHYFRPGDQSAAARPPAVGAVVEPVVRQPAAELAPPSADSAAKPPAVPAPAPENAVANPAGDGCGEVLVALALCTKR